MSVTPGHGNSPAKESSSGEATAAVLDDGGYGDDRSAPGESGTAAERRRRWPWILGAIAIVLGLIASAAIGAAWYFAKQLEGNVTTIEGFVAAEPVKSYEPVNFLIMGSDNRANGNTVEGETPEISGERSDTTLLVHIRADRESALVVSIPRDTLVQLPTCASESGQWEVTAKFNSSFTYGGASCTVEAVERITGIDINHAVVVDFLGFKSMVDAVGGVDVCLEDAVYDRDSGLDLPAGWSTVSGDQALAFVRARKSLGDGSDIDRIARQHQFISSAIREATDAGLLLQPVKLYRMLDAVTKSLSVDAGIDQIGEMATMATSLRGLRPENIKFVTMPFFYSPDGSDVVINEPIADEIWAAISNDEEWPKAPEEPGVDALTVPPAEISVLVANGNGKDNAATNAAADLQGIGFGISGLAMADAATYAQSVVVYNPVDAEAARTVQSAVPGSIMRASEEAPIGSLQLIVGSNYSGAERVSVARVPAGTADDPLPTTADQSICSS